VELLMSSSTDMINRSLRIFGKYMLDKGSTTEYNPKSYEIER
jgi:hypothetical protein